MTGRVFGVRALGLLIRCGVDAGDVELYRITHSRSLLSPIFTIDSGRVASDAQISPAIILLVFFNLDSKVFKTSLFAMETIPSKLISPC